MESNKRAKKILADCFTKEKLPTIEDWAFELNVSRPTVGNDLKRIKEWLRERGLELKGKPGVGYSLVGEEWLIRDAFVDSILYDNIEQQKSELLRFLLDKNKKKVKNLPDFLALPPKEINLLRLRDFVDHLEKVLEKRFTDTDYLKLFLTIAFSIFRIKEKHFLIMEPQKLFNIMQVPEYKIIYQNMLSLELFYDIKFSPEEAGYITIHFIGSRVQELSASLPTMLSIKSKEKCEIYTKKIVQIAEDIFGLQLSKDKEFIRMLSLHLKTALRNIQYGIRIENPLLKEIKSEYPLPFSIAERFCSSLNIKNSLSIPEAEVGYIAVYIAMALEKIKYMRWKRKKVAVVSAMAIGTSSLLFWRLLNEIPEIDIAQVGSYKDVLDGKIGPGIDFIISTIPLPEINISHIVVSPFLNSEERKAIRTALGILRNKWKPTSSGDLNEVLDINLIFVNLETNSFKDLIMLMGETLYENGYVKEKFTYTVIEREKKFPTGLETLIPIALPHADANFTLKKGIAIATLKKPVIFYNMGEPKNFVQVRIVLMPVLTLNAEDNVEFYEILKKCRDVRVAQTLLNCNTPIEIKKTLVKSFGS
jgi:transcriptional antiterminator/mannitol/fructose-specific phosphotransferase system IIA component (Ntr-type)